jgi:dTDP-glucose 4,6-dehydratase
MRILVTGAAGFIGSNFVRRRVRTHPEDEIIAFDLLTYAGTLTNLTEVEERITFVQGDIADAEAVDAVLGAAHVDLVINFAAESHNSLAVVDPLRFARTNVLGTSVLIEAARRAEVGRFHHISTCEVYGEMALDDPGAFTEESPYRPRTPYNSSKAAADLAVRAYMETFDLPATISNCCNNYGPHQFPEKIIPLFITNALDDLPLPLYASTENRREWIHVDDHCAGIDLVLEKGELGHTYNIGTGLERSITQIADAVLAATGKPESLKTIVPDRPAHDTRYLLDSSKIAALGWRPEIDFATGLASTVAWYTEHRAWWEPLKARAPIDERAWKRDGGVRG